MDLIVNPFAPPMPTTPAQWQVCADIANHILTHEMARTWNLVDDSGQPNVKRCEWLLVEAKRYGISPRTMGPATIQPKPKPQ